MSAHIPYACVCVGSQAQEPARSIQLVPSPAPVTQGLVAKQSTLRQFSILSRRFAANTIHGKSLVFSELFQACSPRSFFVPSLFRARPSTCRC